MSALAVSLLLRVCRLGSPELAEFEALFAGLDVRYEVFMTPEFAEIEGLFGGGDVRYEALATPELERPLVREVFSYRRHIHTTMGTLMIIPLVVH